MQRILYRYFPESISDRIKYISKDKLPPFLNLYVMRNLNTILVSIMGFLILGYITKNHLFVKKNFFYYL